MDLLLLAPAGPQDPRLFSSLGEQRLEGLITWFIDRGEFVRLYAFVPADDAALRWLLDRMSGIARRYGLETSAILPAERLGGDLLEALHARGILDLVLTAEARQLDAVLAATARIDGYPWRHGRAAAARSGRGLSCRLWLEPGDDGEDLQRLSILRRRAPWLAVEAPGFDLPAAPPRAAAELPEELRARRGGCWLYDLSLTIDAAGRVPMCPRHGNVAEGTLGDVFLHTPEELLARKEAGQSRVGESAPCRRCHVRGRFQWPEPERPRPAVPAPPVAVPVVESREIPADQPQAAAQALADFELRLQAWSAELEDWEADGDA
jgi:hypothetical protein